MMNIRWTPEEDRLIRQIYSVCKTKSIQKQMPTRSLSAIRIRASKLKVTDGIHGLKEPEPVKPEIVKVYEDMKSVLEKLYKKLDDTYILAPEYSELIHKIDSYETKLNSFNQ